MSTHSPVILDLEMLLSIPSVLQTHGLVHCSGNIPPDCNQVLYTWAPGSETFAMPNDTTLALGKGSGYKTFLLEVHYNNVDQVSDEYDASMMEVHYTSKAREHSCAPPNL
jgi:hypothetical protein